MISIRPLLISLAFCASALTTHAAHAAEADPSIDDTTLTAEEQAEADQWKRFVADSVKSSDLRLRILLSQGDLVLSGKNYVWVGGIPVESLVEQARGSTDPLVLASLIARCEMGAPKQPRCKVLDLARRWTMADTQNQLAWLTLASELKQHGDLEGARATFIRASEASIWHDNYGDGSRVLAHALPRAMPPLMRLYSLHRATNVSAIFTLGSSALSNLSRFCKDAALRKACLRIVDTMSRDADNLMSLRVAAGLTEYNGAPEMIARARRQRADAIYWGAMMSYPRDISKSDPTAVAAALNHAEQLIELGEIAVAQRNLTKSGISEAEAAARFAAAYPRSPK